MIDTLNIGKYIYSRLSQIEGVKSYPLIADNDAKLPFIVYKRMNLESTGSKDGYYEDKVTMEVVVVTDKYYRGIELANQVREILEVQSTRYEGVKINDTLLTLATEDYSNNAFVQRMQFEMIVNNE